MNRVISMNPFRCRMWDHHDRIVDHMTEEACKPELKSFQQHGQLLPVLGRYVRGDPDHDVELIFGARRLFVARTLKLSLQVELRDISDRDAFIAMDIENRHRKDISPYERGVSYHRWLQSGQFKSQEDIAHALGISPSQVSRLLKLARLPAVILGAFRSPLEIKEGWGIDLYDAWQDPTRRKGIAEKARTIAVERPRWSATQIYEKLLSGSSLPRRVATRMRDEVIKGHGGAPIFRIRYQRKAVAVLLPTRSLPKGSLEEIKTLLVRVLQRESSQAPVPTVYFEHDADLNEGCQGSICPP